MSIKKRNCKMQTNNISKEYSLWLQPQLPSAELIDNIKNSPFSRKSLKNQEELNELVKRYRRENIQKPIIYVGAGTCGIGAGINKSILAIENFLRTNKIDAKITKVGCLGMCSVEPVIEVQLPRKARIAFQNALTENIEKILSSIFNNIVPNEFVLCQHKSEVLKTWEGIPFMEELPFFKNQVRRVLSNCGIINPVNLNEYIAMGGYSNLAKVLIYKTPEDIIQAVEQSQLRGRGGGGFPTSRKWKIARQTQGKEKYLICNADEGDPGAFMDRAVIESDTYRLLEGIAIASYAIGAKTAYIYIRAEYPLAIERLNYAITEAKKCGLLGKNILGKKFDLEIKIKKGAGAFVCGEETALIHSIEGKRGMPRPRPPYPAESGLFGKPTVINNVETLVNIPVIMEIGGEKFASIGTEGSKGTKVFALSGMVNRTGLVEVPMGVSIKKIVYDIGGGIIGNKKCKAVQMGGPSGGCIPSSHLDIEVEYESLKKLGAIMGSGGMVVMSEGTCMVDLAKYFMEFIQNESCGKCTPCREGTKKMLKTLKSITTGAHSENKTDTLNRFRLIMDLEDLANKVKELSLCGLGQTAPNPVLSTLRWFRDEYEAHIFERYCPAGVCPELSTIPCQSGCPVSTEVWRYAAHIARGEYEEAFKVIRTANPFPSACARVCNNPCEELCRCKATGGEAIAVRTLKRFVVDNVSPELYKAEVIPSTETHAKIAVIGAGPSGLTAAHYLSLKGNKVTVFERECLPGGMLVCAIPSYRMPRDILREEISSLLNSNIEINYNKALGKDFSLSDLQKEYKAVYISIGAHKTSNLGIPEDNIEGIIPSITYLKAYNLQGKNHAKGKVGIIGGGNSAIDAARMAIRQGEVESVTILYRRGVEDMPAYKEEIQAAIKEGVKIVPLVAPLSIKSIDRKLKAITLIKNKFEDDKACGRRNVINIPGSEFDMDLDTIIVAIGEKPETDYLTELEKDNSGKLLIKNDTFETNVKGVFAGGDAVNSQNTVIQAIAEGKKAAVIIDRYIAGKPIYATDSRKYPAVYVEPVPFNEEEMSEATRVNNVEISADERHKNFREVECCISKDAAKKEAQRCLRCDLLFTKPKNS